MKSVGFLLLLILQPASSSRKRQVRSYIEVQQQIFALRDEFAASIRQKYGYTVSLGSFGFFFLSDCAVYNLTSCFALNPGSPYGYAHLPPGPRENVPFRGCVTKTGNCGNGCQAGDKTLYQGVCKDDLPMQWRLEQSEAVVIIMQTPPKAMYWSWTSYLMSRYYVNESRTREPDIGDFDPLDVKCPDGPARCQTFNSLGDPINHRTVADSAGSSSTGFDELVAVVFTGDKTTYDALNHVLRKDILGDNDAHIYPYPVDMLNMGVDTDERDMLTMLLRIAYPEDPEVMKQYYDYAPIGVVRVTPPEPVVAPPQYYLRSDLSFTDRGTGKLERAPGMSAARLRAYVDELAKKIQGAHGGKKLLFEFQRPFFDSGLDCFDEGTECNGDCGDTLYPISKNVYSKRHSTIDNGNNEIYVVFGVNHKATGQATYSSVALYWFNTLSGIFAPSSENGFDGSAAVYLGEDHPANPYLFAYRFARNCSGKPYCYDVPKTGDISVPEGGQVFWIERMYLQPETGTGQNPDETILAKVLHIGFP